MLALIQLLAWWLFSLAGMVALFMLLPEAPRAVSALLSLGVLRAILAFCAARGTPSGFCGSCGFCHSSGCSGWLQQAKPVVTIVPNNPGALNACRTGEGALLLATALSRCDRHPLYRCFPDSDSLCSAEYKVSPTPSCWGCVLPYTGGFEAPLPGAHDDPAHTR